MKEKEKKKLGDRKDFSFFICVWLGVRGQKMKKRIKSWMIGKILVFFICIQLEVKK